jgi:hypothetical protein
MIKHRCPACDAQLSHRDELAGWELSCTHCRARITVPAAPPAPAIDVALELQLALARAQGQLPPLPGTPPPPGARRRLLVLAAIPLVGAGLAWLLAGHWLWLIPGLFGAAIGVGLVLALLGHLLKGHLPGRVELAAVGYMALVLGTWFGVGWFFQVGKVHVDNASGQELRVQRDGRDWLTCPPGAQLVTSLGPGTHRLRVLDRNGQPLDEMTVEVDRQGVYVLNLLRAQVYHRGSVDYGGFGFGSAPRPVEIRDAWFDARVDYLFEEPPQSITVSRRRGQVAMASRTFLLRGRAPVKPR